MNKKTYDLDFQQTAYMDAKTKKVGYPIRLYEIEEQPDVSNEEIIERNLVHDAKNTGEVWYTKEVKPTKNWVYFITDVRHDNDGSVAYKGYELDDVTRIVNPLRYEEICKQYKGMDWRVKVKIYHCTGVHFAKSW